MAPRKPSDPGGGPGRPEQRAALLAGAVDHVLQHGMTRLSLRPLAADLGTSDRMLLYYFGTRDGLVVALLTEVGEQLRSHLASGVPSRPASPADVLTEVWAAASRPAADPYLRLYLEVTSLAARGEEPYRSVAGGLTEAWLSWFESRLDLPAAERRPAALGVLAAVDGLLLLRHAVSAEAAATAADWLTTELRPPAPPAPAGGAAARRAPRRE